MKRLLLIATLTAGLGAPALANDSSAELAAGGLVLTRTDDVEMRSEDLYVSEKEVRVRYVFVNTSGKDVTLRVAFPMPEIGGPSFPYEPSSVPNADNAENPLDFSTTVNGKPVKMTLEERAFANGVDRTAWLKERAVPLAPFASASTEKLDTLPEADRKQALAWELVIEDQYDAGKGWETHYPAAWIWKATYHWEQLFPAGQEVVVEHRYRPATGYSAGTVVGYADAAKWEQWPDYKARYCIDDAFVAAAAKTRKDGDYPLMGEARIGYVLKTGGNWAKPIGDFRLVVDKGSPVNIVSFCASGVRKIGPTQFEVRKTNWTPDRDLDVLILQPYPTE